MAAATEGYRQGRGRQEGLPVILQSWLASPKRVASHEAQIPGEGAPALPPSRNKKSQRRGTISITQKPTGSQNKSSLQVGPTFKKV